MSELLNKLRAKLAEARESHVYRKESVILDFTEDLVVRMDELGMTRSELARKLDTSPAYVTKILRGNANFTLDSLVKIAHAVGCQLSTHLTPCDREAMWIEVMTKSAVGVVDTAPSEIEQCVGAEEADELAVAA